MLQIVTTLTVLMRRDYGFPVSWFRNLDDACLDLLPLDGFEPCGCTVISSKIQFMKQLIHVDIVR